jgi:CxxC motif-containing protein (DUF1111 family)
MTEERKKILEMLAEGKITAADAERLIDKIDATSSSDPQPPLKPGGRSKIKWLLVRVDSNDGDQVNLRVPINLIRTGIKLGAILPSGASERIQASGIDLGDLATLADEELVEALADLQVDVNSEDGDVVRIYCE